MQNTEKQRPGLCDSPPNPTIDKIRDRVYNLGYTLSSLKGRIPAHNYKGLDKKFCFNLLKLRELMSERSLYLWVGNFKLKRR